MSRMDQLERQFRQLHSQSVKDFDEVLHRRREEHARMFEERAAERAEELKKISRILQVPPAVLKRRDPTVHGALKTRITKARSSLTDRESQQANDAKRFSQHPALVLPNKRTIPLYATSLMSATREDLAEIPGERGNPWVLPWNPGHIKIKQTSQDDQYGLCGWAQVATFPIVADVWFAFLADTTANWNLLALANLHGFFLLNATNQFLLCRDARVTVDVSTQVYQYFWFPETSTRVVDEDSDSGFRSGSIDQFLELETAAPLRADSEWYVFLRLRFAIYAISYHGFSEINFADGSANFIDPLILVASPG
jgi:hypothetical protein